MATSGPVIRSLMRLDVFHLYRFMEEAIASMIVRARVDRLHQMAQIIFADLILIAAVIFRDGTTLIIGR